MTVNGRTWLRIPTTTAVRSLASHVTWFVFPYTVLLVVWSAVSAAEIVPRVWLPRPADVWDALQSLVASGTYLENIEVSLGRLMLGFAVSAALATSLGMFMGLRRGLADFVGPVVSFLNALSGIVWIPIAILWFGLGTATITFVIWNSMFFIILLNTLVGVKSVPRVYESALLTMGATRWRLIRDVMLPGALPNIVAGLRLGMGFGWRALIAAEMFAASSGLGYMIFNASYYFRSDVILVGLFTIGTIWLITDRVILVPFESWTVRRWGLVSTR